MKADNIIFQEVKEQLNDQMQTIGQITAKFNFLLAFNGIILASLIQFDAGRSGIDYWQKTSIIFLLASIVFNILGLGLRPYRKDPQPSKLKDKYWGKEEEDVKKTLVANFAESYEENEKKMASLYRLFRLSLYFSIAAVLCIAASIWKEEVLLCLKAMSQIKR